MLEMTKDSIDEKLDFLLYFRNTRLSKHMNKELMIKANKPPMSADEYIDVSSEEILDEVAEQNKYNDVVFDTEKLE
jgi:hypothetical protein